MRTFNLTYFAYLQTQSKLSNLNSNAISHLVNSNGVFGYEPHVAYMFGIPKNVKSGGVILDVPIDIITQAKDNNKQR